MLAASRGAEKKTGPCRSVLVQCCTYNQQGTRAGVEWKVKKVLVWSGCMACLLREERERGLVGKCAEVDTGESSERS